MYVCVYRVSRTIRGVSRGADSSNWRAGGGGYNNTFVLFIYTYILYRERGMREGVTGHESCKVSAQGVCGAGDHKFYYVILFNCKQYIVTPFSRAKREKGGGGSVRKKICSPVSDLSCSFYFFIFYFVMLYGGGGPIYSRWLLVKNFFLFFFCKLNLFA